ncbi:MAG: AraC family transcriptional regulator [bacterium]|nr:AraC family transcriptional regulator [bacterium]
MIAFWRGSVVYVGRLPDLPLHAHLAAAVCAGLDGAIEIRGQGLAEWSACRSALIPPGAEHELRTKGGRFGTVLTEPGAANEWNPASNFAEDAGSDDPIEVDPESGAKVAAGLRALADSLESTAGRAGDGVDTELESTLSAMLGPAQTSAAGRSEMDPRLLRVIEFLLQAPADAPDVVELAAAIDMSPSWLQHNFRKRIGVPIRRFRTFFRLKAAACFMRDGASMVAAALDAGFYDQSHFSNAFRGMFGIQPGLVLSGEEHIRWYIDDESLVKDFADRDLLHLA